MIQHSPAHHIHICWWLTTVSCPSTEDVLELASTGSGKLIAHISAHFRIQRCLFGRLKLTMVEVFTPQNQQALQIRAFFTLLPTVKTFICNIPLVLVLVARPPKNRTWPHSGKASGQTWHLGDSSSYPCSAHVLTNFVQVISAP